LAVKLLANGHELGIVSSNIDRKKEIQALGAEALIGQMEDEAFIQSAFVGADLVYCMEIIDRALMTGTEFILDVMVDRVKHGFFRHRSLNAHFPIQSLL
jgi:hypothetical protein